MANRKKILTLMLYIVFAVGALAVMPPIKAQATCSRQKEMASVLAPVRSVLLGVQQSQNPCGENGVCTGHTTHYDCAGGCTFDGKYWTPQKGDYACPAGTCAGEVKELTGCGTQNKPGIGQYGTDKEIASKVCMEYENGGNNSASDDGGSKKNNSKGKKGGGRHGGGSRAGGGSSGGRHGRGGGRHGGGSRAGGGSSGGRHGRGGGRHGGGSRTGGGSSGGRHVLPHGIKFHNYSGQRHMLLGSRIGEDVLSHKVVEHSRTFSTAYHSFMSTSKMVQGLSENGQDEQKGDNHKRCKRWQIIYKESGTQTITQAQRGKVPYGKRTCVMRHANCCASVANRHNGGNNNNPPPQPPPTAVPPVNPPQIHVQPLPGDKVVYMESFDAEAHDTAKDKAQAAGLPAGARNMPVRFSFELKNIPSFANMKATVVFQHEVNGTWKDAYKIDVYPTEYDEKTETAKYEQFSDPEKYIDYAKRIKGEKDPNGELLDKPNDGEGIWQHNTVVGLCPYTSMNNPYVCLGTGPFNPYAALVSNNKASVDGYRLDYNVLKNYIRGKWRIVVKYGGDEKEIGRYRIIWYTIESGG